LGATFFVKAAKVCSGMTWHQGPIPGGRQILRDIISMGGFDGKATSQLSLSRSITDQVTP